MKDKIEIHFKIYDLPALSQKEKGRERERTGMNNTCISLH